MYTIVYIYIYTYIFMYIHMYNALLMYTMYDRVHISLAPSGAKAERPTDVKMPPPGNLQMPFSEP